MLRQELARLGTWQERHRRLVARLTLALLLTLLVDVIGSVLIWHFERGIKSGDIHGFGDAVFLTTVQLLTVSSSMKNPLATGGRVVDIFLEGWSIFVITAAAGSFSAFFGTGDA
jgi:hypothetical protein